MPARHVTNQNVKRQAKSSRERQSRVNAKAVLLLHRADVPKHWRKAQVALVLSAALILVWLIQPIEYDNTRSRYLLAASMAERGTFSIDPYKEETHDLARSGGHFYSNKAIGAPILGAPVWWALRHLTPLRDRLDLDPSLFYWVRVITTSLPTALFMALFAEAALILGASPAGALALALAYLLGTPAILHGSTFSGHQLAAIFCFTGFALAVIGLRRSHRPGLMLGMAGLLVGWGVLSDYIAVAIAIAITVYVLAESISSRKRLLLVFFVGAAVPAGILVLYNVVCFSSPFSLSYAHQTLEVFEQGSRHGLLGITFPDPKALFMLVFSPSRGLLMLSPFLLLGCAGLGTLLRNAAWKKEAVVLAAAILGPLLINAGFYGWHGGWTYGPRYLVAGVPFLAVAAAPVLGRVPFLFAGLAVVSVALYVPAAVGCQYPPQLFVNPLFEVVFPLFTKGYWVGTPLGSQDGATPWAIVPILAFVVPSVLYVAVLARSRASGGVSVRRVSNKVQLGMLVGAIVAGILVFGFARTRSDGVIAAELHLHLGRLLLDPWDVRPNLLAQAGEEFAQGERCLPENLRQATSDLISLQFTALAREAGWLWRIGRHSESEHVAGQALTALEQWLERLPTSKREFSRFQAGTLLALTGRADLGLQQLLRVSGLSPDHPTFLMTNALERLQRGQIADALATAHQLVVCCPDSNELALFVSECVQSEARPNDLEAVLSLVNEATHDGAIPERLRVTRRVIEARLRKFGNG